MQASRRSDRFLFSDVAHRNSTTATSTGRVERFGLIPADIEGSDPWPRYGHIEDFERWRTKR